MYTLPLSTACSISSQPHPPPACESLPGLPKGANTEPPPAKGNSQKNLYASASQRTRIKQDMPNVNDCQRLAESA